LILCLYAFQIFVKSTRSGDIAKRVEFWTFLPPKF